jgi:hypothetical protein
VLAFGVRYQTVLEGQTSLTSEIKGFHCIQRSYPSCKRIPINRDSPGVMSSLTGDEQPPNQTATNETVVAPALNQPVF